MHPEAYHDLPSEQALVGCLLLDAKAALDELAGKFTPEAFYDFRHRTLWDAAGTLLDSNRPVDTFLMRSLLQGPNPAQGGASEIIGYMLALQENAPASAMLASYYAENVMKQYARRKVQEAFAKGMEIGRDGDGSAQQMLDAAEQVLQGLGVDLIGQPEFDTKGLVHDALRRFEECMERQGALRGLSTGYSDLDQMTSGLQPGDMFVIAARPSVGKTSLAMNIADHVSTSAKIPVGVFSLEMTRESLIERMICSRARVNIRSVQNGQLVESDFPKITTASQKIAAAPLFIDDTPGLNILDLRARARRMHRKHGVRLIVVDYLQLLHGVTKKGEGREREVANISNGIKAILKELRIPGIILAQLNRATEKENRRPRLSDLRESGAIEQDADIAALLYCPEDDVKNPQVLPIKLAIAKQRNGPTGDIDFTFFKEFTRYEQQSRIHN